MAGVWYGEKLKSKDRKEGKKKSRGKWAPKQKKIFRQIANFWKEMESCSGGPGIAVRPIFSGESSGRVQVRDSVRVLSTCPSMLGGRIRGKYSLPGMLTFRINFANSDTSTLGYLEEVLHISTWP